MFKRIGTPVQVDLLAFDSSKATEIKCRCGCVLGHRCGGIYSFASSSPKLLVSDFKIKCSACGEETNV